MKITLIQNHPLFSSVDSNFKNLLDCCDKYSNQILVFPELATSGYFFVSKKEIEQVALETTDTFFKSIKKIAKKNNLIICFGYAEKSKGKVYNSAALIFPNGKVNNYRKTHLFYKEKLGFTPGDTGFKVFEYKPWDIKIGLMICYDWRFPEAARSISLQGADLILCPSNLVTDLWHDVMKARAIENGVYLAVANRVGTEKRTFDKKVESLLFKGQSVIISPKGERLAQASAEGVEEITAEIEPKESRNKSINSLNDIFADRRPDMYFTKKARLKK